MIFAPDGKAVARVTAASNLLRVFDVASGRSLISPIRLRDSMNTATAAFRPKGDRLATLVGAIMLHRWTPDHWDPGGPPSGQFIAIGESRRRADRRRAALLFSLIDPASARSMLANEVRACSLGSRRSAASAVQDRAADTAPSRHSPPIRRTRDTDADHEALSIDAGMTRAEQIRYLATGTGFMGTSIQYLSDIAEHFTALGIEDAEVTDLWRDALAHHAAA